MTRRIHRLPTQTFIRSTIYTYSYFTPNHSGHLVILHTDKSNVRFPCALFFITFPKTDGPSFADLYLLRYTQTHTPRHTKKQSTLSLLFSWSFQLAAARRGRVGTARVEVPGGMERHMARSSQGQLGGRETGRVCVCVCVSI